MMSKLESATVLRRKASGGALRMDELGYRSVNTWPGVTPDTARVIAINPRAQIIVEKILRGLRQ